ncbi:hypothetical protein TrCOL_g2208 [Triparma columacea]|uniref:WDR19 first beta-propeller domain-containing protein n=1 Tax=Triparma columacea TaxID=722753 RepID=A0A9W7L5B2_9STRA|nr:hypothetical protein TrCOL_g2208 [Triparma columacea]
MARGAVSQRNRGAAAPLPPNPLPPNPQFKDNKNRPFLKPVSVLSNITLGQGRAVFQVHPFLPLVASCGESRVIQISSSELDPAPGSEVSPRIPEVGEGPAPTLVVDQIIPPSPTNVTSLRWSPDGGWLAATQQNSSKVVLWNLSTRESKSLEAQDKNLTFLAFADTKGGGELRLAVGTGRGTCVIYDVKTGMRVATTGGGGGKGGKSKTIVGGGWGLDEDGCLGYWTHDGTIVLADRGGKETGTISVRAGIREVSFSPEDNRTLVIVPNKKKAELSVVELSKDCQKKVQTELVFKPEWGEIVKTIWMPNGSLLVGFKEGYIVNLDKERKVQRFAGKFITSDEAPLIDMAYHPRSGSVAFGSIAIATSKKVKLVNLNSGTSTFEVCEWAVDEPSVRPTTTTTCMDNIAFTKSGLVCASTSGGSILLFEKANGGVTLLMAAAEKMIVLFSDFSLLADISATAFMAMAAAFVVSHLYQLR